jgi:hypothetical protein
VPLSLTARPLSTLANSKTRNGRVFNERQASMASRVADLYPEAAAVSTEKAAKALDKRPQTLRRWACFESGPIRPVRINGRLLWRVSDLERLLEGAA